MDDQIQDIEAEEVVNPVEQEAPEVEKPAQSLRETIEKARDEAKKDPEEKVIKVKSHKRVVSKDTKPKADIEPVEVKQEVKQENIIPAPRAYTGPVKAKWAELPADIQKELSEREEDFHRQIVKYGEDASFGKQMKDVVTPYVAQIRAEGAEPAQAVANLLNMAHVLRVGSPQQKSDLLLRTAQTFGVDLRQALQVQQTQPQLPPQVQQTMQEVQNLKQRLEQQEALKKQQEDLRYIQIAESFIADTKNYPHAAALEQDMVTLLRAGMFTDASSPQERLQKVYDYAVYANPHTRTSLLEAQKAENQEKRVAEQKARAEAARKAGSSIKGAPGITATKNGQIKGLDLRSTIQSAWSEHMDS